MKKSEKVSIAYQIIDVLCNRGGFDDWWHNIDEDIQLEILEEMSEKIDSVNDLKEFYDKER